MLKMHHRWHVIKQLQLLFLQCVLFVYFADTKLQTWIYSLITANYVLTQSSLKWWWSDTNTYLEKRPLYMSEKYWINSLPENASIVWFPAGNYVTMLNTSTRLTKERDNWRHNNAVQKSLEPKERNGEDELLLAPISYHQNSLSFVCNIYTPTTYPASWFI